MILKRVSPLENYDPAKDLIHELKHIENIQVHPKITFYVLMSLSIIGILISASAVIFYQKLIIPNILHKTSVQLPITNDNQIYPKLPAAQILFFRNGRDVVNSYTFNIPLWSYLFKHPFNVVSISSLAAAMPHWGHHTCNTVQAPLLISIAQAIAIWHSCRNCKHSKPPYSN